MTSDRFNRLVRRMRRIVQGAALILFVWLLLAGRWRIAPTLAEPMQVFFDLDPLVLVATWLSAHTVPLSALLALITIAVTLLLGRVFCGWFCPLGTVHAMFSWLRHAPLRELVRAEQWTRWQRGKYYLLIALLVMALFSAQWVGVLDPLALLYRSTATVLLPAAQYPVEEGATAIYRADPRVGPFRATDVTEPVYRFFRDRVFAAPRQAFAGSTWIALLFVGIVLLNLVRRRFWCRYICPLGAFLGTVAQRPVLRLVTDGEQCGGCNLCVTDCQGAAQPNKPGEWMPSECFGCFNCATRCPSGAISFRFASPWVRSTTARLDLSRRAALVAATAGVGGLLLFRLSPQAQGRTFHPFLIRPPGALPEPDFLDRCIQCGLCMRVCPKNALHPVTTQAGLEGLWTPVLIPRIGYCEFECNLCGQVCLTGAIAPLTLPDKQQVKIGLASIDTTRCIPYAYERNCIVCEEHCPVHKKAIFFKEVDVLTRSGEIRRLKQPHVDPSRCIGCGICENVCPFKDLPAIRVTSANETRHPANQPILDQTVTREDEPGNDTPYTDPYGG